MLIPLCTYYLLCLADYQPCYKELSGLTEQLPRLRSWHPRSAIRSVWHQTIHMDQDGTLLHDAKSCAALNAVEKAVYADVKTETFRPHSGQMWLAKPSLKAL